MKIHALQTGTVRTKQFQLTGARNNLSRLYQVLFTSNWSEWLPIYAWLIELGDKLILVDTGETADIYNEGYLPKGGLYHKVVQTKIDPSDEVVHQLKKLGFHAKDVTSVILTHMHGDHIGGLKHFPHCDTYVSRIEYEFATSKKGKSNGYFSKNWPQGWKPILIDYRDGAIGPFNKSYKFGKNEAIRIVPTPGHSMGHQSVIVENKGLTYLIAGDLTYNVSTLKDEVPDVLLSNKQSKETVDKVHQFVRRRPCVFLSSHDWNAPGLLSQKQCVYEI